MADTTVKKIICSSCGAEFEDTLPKCPYCGSLNYKGAEAEYLGKLESMRQDMQQLEQVPEKELKKKLKKKQKFVIKLLIILAALAAILAVIVFRAQYIEPRDARADYLWEKENFPILDRLYQEKDLEALMDFYEQAVEENRTIDRWEHSGIFRWLMSCRDAREYLPDCSGLLPHKDGYTLCLPPTFLYCIPVPAGSSNHPKAVSPDNREVSLHSVPAPDILSHFGSS